jgi:hypothetical protein
MWDLALDTDWLKTRHNHPTKVHKIGARTLLEQKRHETLAIFFLLVSLFAG